LRSIAVVRRVFVTVGVSVWVPYLILQYGFSREVAVWPVLAVHVPCMVGALGIRLWEAARGKGEGGG